MSIFAASFELTYYSNNEMMKKALVIFTAFMAVSTITMASPKTDSIRYLDSRFNQNWFIGFDGSINWWKGSDRNPNGNYTAVQWGRPSFGGGITAGKWVNHVFGLRLSYDINQGKSYINGLHVDQRRINFLFDGTFKYDENGNFVSYTENSENGKPDKNGYYNTSFMYHNLHIDFLFSPIDIFQGYYNPDIIYRPIIYVGMGLASVSEGVFVIPTILYNNRNKNNVDAQKGINYEFSFDFGLLNTFKLNSFLDLFVDLGCTMQRYNIDTWFNEMGSSTEDVIDPNQIRPARTDKNFSAKVGLSFNINKGYTLPYNCTTEMEEMRWKIKTLEDDMANMEANAEVTVVHDTITQFVNAQTEDIISYPFSIFFELDSYQIMSKRDLINLREIAEVAKKNNYKIRLRGSADSATASPVYNQTLSENRCRKVMIELMDMGIPQSQIILVPVGGVNELNPAEYDRRVLIELVKEAPKN